MKKLLVILPLIAWSCSKGDEDTPPAENLFVHKISLEGEAVSGTPPVETSLQPEIRVEFSQALDPATSFRSWITLLNKNSEMIALDYQVSDKTLIVKPPVDLGGFQKYTFIIRKGLSSAAKGTLQNEQSFLFYTTHDQKDKFERIPAEALLDKVQAQTFKYFWDFAHASSGMIRERSSSTTTVTTGGTGFGLMAILVGVERKFITRNEGLERVRKITTFLESADSYHGAYSHWYNGDTGKTQPFSTRDNGADLVETSFLFMGLLAAGEYFGDSDLTRRIEGLYQKVEWNFFLNGTESLFWHWSPDYGFELNLKIRGWNEALMTYVLAAGSEKYAIEKTNYINGWTRNGGFVNGSMHHGIRLPLGPDYGGPP
ncbi:MAG: Ig-like domain-containing protein, partial [Leadbetterella sp.]|nr:Ig-like domain-containing protein [Leadbetterella sp.]